MNHAEKGTDRPMGQTTEDLRVLSELVRGEADHLGKQGNHGTDILQKFDQCQLEMLSENIKNLDNYCFLLSSEIKHQESSVSTLPQRIIESFPQLKMRKQEMIDKGRKNLKLIELILQPYRILTRSPNLPKPENQHIHSHSHVGSTNIVNMFYHLTSEWSREAEIKNIKRVVAYSQKYWEEIVANSHQGQKRQIVKVLIVGCGMGRILSEFKRVFKAKGVDALLQGHESDTENYLCAEYFLNRCTTKSRIYPYIHNFSNFLKSSSAYREVTVPLEIQQKSYFYPITWGPFFELYQTHRRQWSLIVTFFHNYHIPDILAHIKLVYGMLKDGGIWIDFCTANFSSNVISMSYKEYENILEKSQLTTLEKGEEMVCWYEDPECLMNETRKCYFRVMKK